MQGLNLIQGKNISIHALREEGDTLRNSAISPVTHFNPRPPRGGRLAQPDAAKGVKDISIHALREEGDSNELYSGNQRGKFQSTPSARRATPCRRKD